MEKTGHEKDAVRTRKRLIDAAEELMREHGYRAISEPKVCECSQLTRGGLRHHFPRGRYDLIAALAESLFSKLPLIAEGATVKQRVVRLIKFLAEEPDGNPATLLLEIWIASRTDKRLNAVLDPIFTLHHNYLFDVLPDNEMTPDDLPYRFLFHGAILYLYSGRYNRNNMIALVKKMEIDTL